jgi:pimeloyl-ACP methyl ester carboxylesterase
MRKRLLLIGLLVLLLVSCGAFRPAPAPIRSIVVHDAVDARCLAVLLPGRYAAPEGFTRGGFGDAVRARGLDLDVVALDAHLGYYRKRTVIERVRNDVILPARAKGYDQIWLIGTSLGGLGSILYLRQYPQDLTGVLAIAPYLGEEDLIREIESAGGPARWHPPAEIAPDDIGRNVWSWLATGAIRNENVPFRLGWGTHDRFDHSNRLLASMLPSDRVYTVEGAHDMKTWKRVWEKFLDDVKPCRR